MSNYTLSLTPQLYQYMLSVSLREPKVLQELREETARLPGSQMQITPEQGQFMALLIELLNAKKTIDIGVYTGYSALAVALALPEEGRVIGCDVNPETSLIAKTFWQKAGVDHKIDLRLAPALETLDKLNTQGEAGTFDFIFIDADKQNYLNYYEKSLPLLRRGGVIMVDNVLWGGDVADSAINDASTIAIRNFNRALHNDTRVTISLLPVGDGVTLAIKR